MHRILWFCLAFLLLLSGPCLGGDGHRNSTVPRGDTHADQDFNRTQPGDTFNPVAGGAINTRTGEFYLKSGPGLVTPKTGEYMPQVPGGYINPSKGFNPNVGSDHNEDRD